MVTSGMSGGLPRMISSAWICGHGTQLRQPVSCFWRSQTTPRSPRIAKGRLSSVETFWLMVGLSRFQSNVAITMMSTTINNKKTPNTDAVILPAFVIVSVLTSFLACPKDSPAGEKEGRYFRIKATE